MSSELCLPQPPLSSNTDEANTNNNPIYRPYEYVPYDVLETDWLGDPRRLQSLGMKNNNNANNATTATTTIVDDDDDARYAPGTLVWVLLSKGKPKEPSTQSGHNALALHKKRRNKKNKRKKSTATTAATTNNAEHNNNNNNDDDENKHGKEDGSNKEEEDGNGVNANNNDEKNNTNANKNTSDNNTNTTHPQTTLNHSRKEFFLRARVISDDEVILPEEDEGKKERGDVNNNKQRLNYLKKRNARRILVRYSKGATYRVRAYNLVPILEPSCHLRGKQQQQQQQPSEEELPPLVVIVPETSIYRRVARVHTTPDDSFMEIGCDYGITVDKIHTSLEGAGDVPKVWPVEEKEEDGGDDDDEGSLCKRKEGEDDNKVSCLGVDRSKESIDIANERYPKCKFALVNVLEPTEMSSLRTLCEQSLVHSAPSIICIDVNGNREIDGVLKCVEMVMNEMWKRQPRMIIVKSRFLYWELKKTL
eukprot:CAMPEP_0183758446 /NCGR_PEP_ID=MMETSP0739-20130205/6432_1 /TAXON_ID=385413 /ORGANISM="Thalassiosira miniscula, Strain CCMP1093" /LENGTH=476 /DNA_ID=CAMNT_0025996061 /DNA_START=1 /DNA_END=1431 /DNA_ORIENTATION=+